MPLQAPYPLGGVVFKPDGTTGLSGALVTLYNENTGEEIVSNSIATSDSDGSFTVDAANFPSGYTIGDIVVVKARKGYLVVNYRTTLTSNNFENNINITSNYIDPCGLVKDVLSDNWRKGLTDNMLPTFSVSKDRSPAEDTQSGDIVRVYALRTVTMHNGLGSTSAELNHGITVEVVCSDLINSGTAVTGTEHGTLMREEVWRILKNKIVNPDSGTKYNILNPMGGWVDLSDSQRHMGKWALDMDLIEVNQTW